MPDPGDEFERILLEARARLEEINLELPTLENGHPAPLSPRAWAAESLRPARPVPSRYAPTPSASPQIKDEPPSVVPLSENSESRRVRSVELAPSAAATAPEPVQRAADPLDPPPALQPGPRSFAGLIGAAAILAAGMGLWWALRPSEKPNVLPIAAFDAMTSQGSDAWIVASQNELLLYEDSKPRVLSRLTKPLTSIFWTDGTLYGIDGGNTLYLWEKLGAAPKTFSLDHVPLGVFARPPNVWTLDEEGSLRQYILAISMTSVFLQPLDRVALGHTGDFSVARDGDVLLLKRSSGQLLNLTREKSGYAVAEHGSAYGAGGRLLPSDQGHWIARAVGGKTSLIRVPRP